MKREFNIIKFIVILLIVLGLTIYLFINNLLTYGIITLTLSLIIFICLFIYLNRTKSEESIYKSKLKDILKTYEPVLVDSEKLPDLDDKNIVKTSSFDDIINVQLEVRKPICYKADISSCVFILIDEDNAYVYILRVNKDTVSSIDSVIEQISNAKKIKDIDRSILDNIERTTIVKLDNNKSYKISPLDNKDIREIKNKEFIEKLKQDYLPKLKTK